MAFVLDASVTLAWHFEDEASGYAERVLERLKEEAALAPSVWPLEVANGLLAAERRGRISTADVIAASQQTLDLAVSVQEVAAEHALGRILDLARTHALSVYDAAYLDLALREDAPLATLDRGLLLAAQASGVNTLF
jgi:predicted nucleic acid-binding protein